MNILSLVLSRDFFNRERCFLYFLVLLIYATYAHLYFGHYDANIALGGWSALDFSNSVLYPENFVRDYPGGAWSTGNSILPWVYPALQNIGVPAEKSLVVFVMFEMATLSAGAAYLMTTIFNKIQPLAMVALSALLLLSWARFPNLARFGNPFFHGQFYGYADGLGLVAIALYLRERYIFSALILLVAFTIHPLKALFALTFISGMHLWHWRSIINIRRIAPYILFLMFAGFWMWFWLSIGNTEVTITHDEFFRYSRLFNSHWFPQDLEVLTANHWHYITPFISAMLMFFSVVTRSTLSEERKGQLVLGMAMVGILATAGIIVALIEFSPTLVKASFQRSTVLMLSIATLMIVAQSVIDVFSGRWWYGILGIGILSVAFFSRSTWPVILVVVYAISVLSCQEVRLKQPFWMIVLLSVVLFGAVCYEGGLLYYGYQNSVLWLEQFKLSSLVILVALLVAKSAMRFLSEIEYLARLQQAMSILIVVGLTYGSYHWGKKFRTYNHQKVEKGLAYKSVQQWAFDNTEIISLFMVDPCLSYGWRDYSARSSFGSVQEWYKTGWLYSGDQLAMHEGIKRGASLGIDVEILAPRNKPNNVSENISKFCKVARSVFYRPDGGKLAGITVNYDIQYVVMDKLQATKFGAIPNWSKAFENKYYVVLIPPQEQKS